MAKMAARLTPEKNDALNELVRRRMPHLLRPCPACAVSRWEFSDRVFELDEYVGVTREPATGPSTVYPVFPIKCGNCGYTHFVNAIMLGLLDGTTGKFTI